MMRRKLWSAGLAVAAASVLLAIGMLNSYAETQASNVSNLKVGSKSIVPSYVKCKDQASPMTIESIENNQLASSEYRQYAELCNSHKNDKGNVYLCVVGEPIPGNACLGGYALSAGGQMIGENSWVGKVTTQYRCLGKTPSYRQQKDICPDGFRMSPSCLDTDCNVNAEDMDTLLRCEENYHSTHKSVGPESSEKGGCKVENGENEECCPAYGLTYFYGCSVDPFVRNLNSACDSSWEEDLSNGQIFCCGTGAIQVQPVDREIKGPNLQAEPKITPVKRGAPSSR